MVNGYKINANGKLGEKYDLYGYFTQETELHPVNLKSYRKISIFRDLPPSPYCDEIKHDGTRSLATTRCTTQRDSLALCNLVSLKL